MSFITDSANFDFSRLPWQGSADPAAGDEEIVEVAFLDPNLPVHAACIAMLEAKHANKVKIRVLVRNSHGPQTILAFTMAEWDAFVLGAKDGEFDLEDAQGTPGA